MRAHDWSRRWQAPVLFAAALVLAMVALVALLAGENTGAALTALWRGSIGTPYALFSATLVRATPLILAGCAVSVAFRAGALNIGAEGQLLAGAAAATGAVSLLSSSLGSAVLPVAMVVGAMTGAAWAGIAALLRTRFHVLEVISTILLNFVALHAVGWLVRGPLQEPAHVYPQSATLPEFARLPALIASSRLHWGFPLACVIAVVAWLVLSRSEAGFRLRVTGLNPEAARVAGGIDTRRIVTGAMLVSGALAGLAGAVEVHGVTFALYENLSPGYGYTAIAVALLARLDPLLVLPSAIFFGALEAGAAAMQRDAGVPSVIATVIEAGVVLSLLGIAAVQRNRSTTA